jgi:hypothetical protein
MPPWFIESLRALERTQLAEFVRGSPYLYPMLESLHILGIALMVGSAIALDLRLLGIARGIPVTTVARLLPLSHAGFAVVAFTGMLMFVAVAFSVASSMAAPWKFGLIGIAAINILVFHFGIYRSVSQWDVEVDTPGAAKISAAVSALSWIGVTFAGRFIAY